MAMIYLDNENKVQYTDDYNTILIQSLGQVLLSRKGELSFYADKGINWKSIEQGYGDIDFELSSVLKLFEDRFKDLKYTYFNHGNILDIKIDVIFLDDEQRTLTINKRIK